VTRRHRWPYYATRGDVRGWCGHRHRTLQGAVSCLCSDRGGCRAQGGYSDRAIVRVTGSGPGEYEYVDLDIRSRRMWVECGPDQPAM